jgi:predicted RNase H-like HicB family nuclease
MFSDFVVKKLKTAQYKILKNGTYFGEIPSFKGVWANAGDLEDCRRELREVLEEWLLIKIRQGEKIAGFEIDFNRCELVKNA